MQKTETSETCAKTETAKCTWHAPDMAELNMPETENSGDMNVDSYPSVS